jgi:hypothetical protein
VVHFNLTPYDQARATLHDDLKGIYDVTRHSWQFDEVQRVQTVLDSLEGKLTNLKQFLPKPGKKRGWINLGGRLLQVLFGTATTADLEGLHSTVDSLSKNQELIAHSLNQQVSLFKQLDGIVRQDQETISNLTAIVKDYVIKVQDKFQNTVSRLEWMTKRQQVNTAVRSLEFSVMQLEAEIDELVNAFLALGGGKLPISLITFAKLHSILKNVTLALPAGYELVMGSHYSQLPWYHANVRAAMLTDFHSFMLIPSYAFARFSEKNFKRCICKVPKQ